MIGSDSDELLPGEAPGSSEPDDAAHWAAVYRELVEVLLQHPETSAFQQTLGRYRQRLDFWQGRLRDLSAQEGTLGQADGPEGAS